MLGCDKLSTMTVTVVNGREVIPTNIYDAIEGKIKDWLHDMQTN